MHESLVPKHDRRSAYPFELVIHSGLIRGCRTREAVLHPSSATNDSLSIVLLISKGGRITYLRTGGQEELDMNGQ
jgi:hypothetical protein